MNEFLRAYCDREAAAKGEEGSAIRFTVATEGVKRDGLNLVISGARLDNYRKNPIVTWAHDLFGRNLPIGRAEIIVDGNQMDADITFDQEDEFARQIESKYRRGYLHAVSINWNSLRINGRDVTDWELLEIAAVPVPGDPDALMQRQYQALKELLEPEDEDALSPTDTGSGRRSGEDAWQAIATDMVRLFLPGSDDPDDRREKQYKALLPKYRRLGKVPPEFCAKEDLDGLDLEEIRGLFLEGEPELAKGLIETKTRAGAMLSKRNQDDLRQAADLILGVLERAKKEEEPEKEEAPEPGEDRGETGTDEKERQARALQTIFEQLSNFGGQNA